MPSAPTPVTGNGDVNIPGHPKTVALRLLSALLEAVQNANPYGLVAIENQIHLTQAEDALHELQCQLCVTLGLWQYKYQNAGTSQKVNTCMVFLINQFNCKVTACANCFCPVCAALITLDPDGDW